MKEKLPVTPEDLTQIMRTCSLNSIRRQLNLSFKNDPEFYAKLVAFYTKAAKR